ncbi:hypothetical protein RDWZM_000950 [Blomia tropicalis]|uniref:Ubiquitin-like domain-containing CTD phosphatase 1 n=1 Tax=Blomia tropicalis TaxID=40697 RepID=A0A9Q0MAQ1_BLOTA|nr:hypothetical protein RDWZM_000950 [Blomia tropicalis]
MGDEIDIKLAIKWSGNEYEIEIGPNETVADLKASIYSKTRVKPERQKLMGLKGQKGITVNDETQINQLALRPGLKIMMMGSKEEDISNIDLDPSEIPNVLNDFDIEDDLNEVAIHNREEYLAKIERRVKEYKVTVFNEPREGKKLLVLDIDYTLFDHRSTAEHASQLMRPYLHEFLTRSYENYDIVIWSATGMKWIEVKMRELGVTNNPNYKIAFFLDSLAMISVHTQKYGNINVKPLGVIWGKFPQYSSKNTIMFDDIRSNFLMNPQNGLRIKSFREAYKNRDKDKELYYLARYLTNIAQMDDLSTLDHNDWHKKL